MFEGGWPRVLPLADGGGAGSDGSPLIGGLSGQFNSLTHSHTNQPIIQYKTQLNWIKQIGIYERLSKLLPSYSDLSIMMDHLWWSLYKFKIGWTTDLRLLSDSKVVVQYGHCWKFFVSRYTMMAKDEPRKRSSLSIVQQLNGSFDLSDNFSNRLDSDSNVL